MHCIRFHVRNNKIRLKRINLLSRCFKHTCCSWIQLEKILEKSFKIKKSIILEHKLKPLNPQHLRIILPQIIISVMTAHHHHLMILPEQVYNNPASDRVPDTDTAHRIEYFSHDPTNEREKTVITPFRCKTFINIAQISALYDKRNLLLFLQHQNHKPCRISKILVPLLRQR